ncbi:C-X-C motif chemokine 17 [Equus asinus]|uniref:C-X-C motif chemokine ligand 17 n=3 Tax=Equus TaxID=9789 RepID=A0A9L0SUM6_HORSE|nr:C-X-C motif chemokine 17 [Equus caballus]XP_008537698.1 PREDICTED: VEGF coregulated chemokine 1 [Equus przewalskii]XP_014723061.1 C-X-C motif chemokine 17 [Equus asinus]
MKVLVSSLLLLLPLMLMSVVSSSPNPGVAKGHRDRHQASGRWLQAGGQECECKDWLLRAPKRKLMTVPGLPQKQCPCDHFKGNVKKTRHRRHHRKPNKRSRACQQFLKRCQLASLALPL